MFLQAKPVFPAGKSCEMHTFAAFRTTALDIKNATLHIAAADFYQVWINGKFLSFGPARTAKGYAREDELSLEQLAVEGENEIVIGVVCHYCRSLSTVMQPGFLQAEIRRGDEVICATGKDFEGYLPSCRVRKVERFSTQRHFGEVWDFRGGSSWAKNAERCELAVMENPPAILERHAPYAYYEDIPVANASSKGTLTYNENKPSNSLC